MIAIDSECLLRWLMRRTDCDEVEVGDELALASTLQRYCIQLTRCGQTMRVSARVLLAETAYALGVCPDCVAEAVADDLTVTQLLRLCDQQTVHGRVA
ncbi:MAG: hypothetical protein U5L04_02475 [Trueperaceae bacterium]|nr:hypothetical protein [Trueperaceae bacterium]